LNVEATAQNASTAAKCTNSLETAIATCATVVIALATSRLFRRPMRSAKTPVGISKRISPAHQMASTAPTRA
jgi:hypothetical protein